jgi:hypothetical protein
LLPDFSNPDVRETLTELLQTATKARITKELCTFDKRCPHRGIGPAYYAPEIANQGRLAGAPATIAAALTAMPEGKEEFSARAEQMAADKKTKMANIATDIEAMMTAIKNNDVINEHDIQAVCNNANSFCPNGNPYHQL